MGEPAPEGAEGRVLAGGRVAEGRRSRCRTAGLADEAGPFQEDSEEGVRDLVGLGEKFGFHRKVN